MPASATRRSGSSCSRSWIAALAVRVASTTHPPGSRARSRSRLAEPAAVQTRARQLSGRDAPGITVWRRSPASRWRSTAGRERAAIGSRLFGHWFLTHGNQPRHHRRRRVHRHSRPRTWRSSQDAVSSSRAARHGDLEWERCAATLGGILTSLVRFSNRVRGRLMVLRELSIDIVADHDRVGHRGAGESARRTESRARCHLGFFLILEESGCASAISRASRRRRQHRADQPPHDRPARRGGRRAGLPNGTITSLANLSKQYAYAVVDVRMPTARTSIA